MNSACELVLFERFLHNSDHFGHYNHGTKRPHTVSPLVASFSCDFEYFQMFLVQLKTNRAAVNSFLHFNSPCSALTKLVLLSSRGKCNLSCSWWPVRVGSTLCLSNTQIQYISLWMEIYACTQQCERNETQRQSFVSLHHFDTRSFKVRAPWGRPILLPQCLSRAHKHKSVRALRWLQPLGCEDSEILLTASG